MSPVDLLMLLLLLAPTGSQDRTVRLWDLNYGMPLSISRPHGGTVRCAGLCSDAEILSAVCTVVG